MEQNAQNLKKVLDTLINLVREESDIRVKNPGKTIKVDFLTNRAQAKFEYLAFVIKPEFGELLKNSMNIVKEGIGLRFIEYMTADKQLHQKYAFTLNISGEEFIYTFDNEEVKYPHPNVGFNTISVQNGKIFKTIEPMMEFYKKYPSGPIKLFGLGSFVKKFYPFFIRSLRTI